MDNKEIALKLVETILKQRPINNAVNKSIDEVSKEVIDLYLDILKQLS